MLGFGCRELRETRLYVSDMPGERHDSDAFSALSLRERDLAEGVAALGLVDNNSSEVGIRALVGLKFGALSALRHITAVGYVGCDIGELGVGRLNFSGEMVTRNSEIVGVGRHSVPVFVVQMGVARKWWYEVGALY